MKVKLKVEKDFDIKYIEANFGVRYFEDANVNGVEEDEDNPKMPCIVNDRWIIKVDIDSGQIINWKKGTTAITSYKVCDDGKYTLIDKEGKPIITIESYVPDIFAIYDEGFGDYVYLEIDKDGYIKDWECTPNDIKDMVKRDFKYNRDED